MNIDIIGDIHGQLGALQKLGRRLGYAVEDDWRHKEDRKLVFVGDLIDRGPHSLEVAQLVQKLCERGDAICLMGNHELNLIEWRHKRTGPKGSNKATIADVEARRDAWEPVLDFFETLPLALELDGLRVTHAVWNQGCIDELMGLQQPSPSQPTLPDWADFVLLHSPYEGGEHRPEVPFHPYVDPTCGKQWERSLEILLKGHEMDAPKPFEDNDGTLRDKVRAEWWKEGHPEAPKDRRVIFGHYWNMPPIPGAHEAFVPPHPSGHPTLRDWFDTNHEAVADSGTKPVPIDVKTVCIDYNGMTKANGGRPCVGAYRHGEAEVVWATA